MEIESQGKRLLRRAGIGLRIVLGFAILIGSAALAWKGLTKPEARPKQVIVDKDKLGPGMLTVAVAAVDLELIAPDGRRVHTASKTDTSITPAPGAEGRFRQAPQDREVDLADLDVRKRYRRDCVFDVVSVLIQRRTLQKRLQS